MPHETDEERAERQARLSRAMGAMFLQDKVERLERDVQQAPFSRGMARTRSGPSHSRRLAQTTAHPPFRPEGSVRIMTRSTTGPGIVGAAPEEESSAAQILQKAQHPRVYLVDTSLLVYSLRAVHEWLKDPRVQLVVPLEAINNLDLLKKGNGPINFAARKATRFLEERMQSVPRANSSAGLFCQKESERAGLPALEAKRKAVKDSEQQQQQQPDGSDGVSPGAAAESSDAAHATTASPSEGDLYSIKSCPRFIVELLSAAIFLDKSVAEEAEADERLTTAVAFPEDITTTNPGDEALPFADRADGRLSAEWLQAFGIETEVVPIGKSWKGQQHTSKATSSETASQSATPLILLKRPPAGEGVFVPPVGPLRKQTTAQPPSARQLTPSGPSGASAGGGGGSPRFGSISILKSRGPANRSQDSFQSHGTGSHSPLMTSRNASTASLSRPSMESVSPGAEEDETATSSSSSKHLGLTRVGVKKDNGAHKTAAERMEEHVRSLS